MSVNVVLALVILALAIPGMKALSRFLDGLEADVKSDEYWRPL